MKNQVQVRPLLTQDIKNIVLAFNQIDWNKPASLFEEYLKEAEREERLV